MVKIDNVIHIINGIFISILIILVVVLNHRVDELKQQLNNSNDKVVIYQYKLDSLDIRKNAEQEILHNMSDSDAVALFYKLLSDK